jgi:hypothetical protein
VGTVFLSAFYTDPSLNYSSSTSNTDTLTINPAPLTLTAPSFTIVYGQPIPTLAIGDFTGFVNGDTQASLTTQPTGTTDAGTFGNAVGTYPIVGSGASDPNYVITYLNGTLTINADSTITGVEAGPSSVAFGQPIQMGGFATPLYSSVNTLAGSVVFYDNGTLLTTVPMNTEAGLLQGPSAVVGGAAFFTSSLLPGVHKLTAVFSGDANHTGSSSTTNPTATSRSVTITVAPPPNGVIYDTVFHDYNGNGIQDPGEPGIGGVTLYLDLDHSGIFKPGNPTVVTDANGNAQFAGLADGSYTVVQDLRGGELLGTVPNSAGSTVTLNSTGGGQASSHFYGPTVFTSISVPLTLPPSTAFPPQGSATADYVEALYRSILNRNADPGGLAGWTNALNSGTLSRLQVVQAIRNSPEHFTQEVTDFYMTLLSRAPDASGLQSWVQKLEGGLREEQMAFYFLDSPEYLSQGDKHFVDQMYLSLLGRSFDSTGEASWLNALGTGSQTHQQVINDFLYSTESLSRLTEGYYEVYLQRQADPAGLNGWVASLQQGTPFLTTGQLFLASDEFYNRAASQG